MNNYFDLFDNPDSEDIELDEKVLSGIWDGLIPAETDISIWDGKTIFMDGVKELAAGNSTPEVLYLKTKGWKINVKKNLVKSLIVAPAIGGLLYSIGFRELAATLLPAIIPILFDVENVELSRKEEEILLHLPLKPDKKKYRTSGQWYESLPKEIRQQVNEYDFKDFIEKLVLAGYAQEGQHDRYLIFPKGKNIFKIKFA